MTSTTAALESVRRSLSEIVVVDDRDYAWENPRRFLGYARRLELVLNQLLRSFPPSNIPPTVHTSFKGISTHLAKAAETLSVYKNNSKIFVLIKCSELCASLQESTVEIGGWLALLDSALTVSPDLQKKLRDLSKEMKQAQAQFKVTETEERVRLTLRREGEGRKTSKAVQSAILMDLARALGIDSNNCSEISEQVKLLKKDLRNSTSSSPIERRILMSLERIVDNWHMEPHILTQEFDLECDDESHISPFKNFLCPLTNEVMKDPVVLESSQTYERTAIEYWFQRCTEDAREPTCPVTGMVLTSLELKPNIGLAGAIEEWVSRNIEIQVKSTVQCLSENPPSKESIESVLDKIYRISEEHPTSRYKVRNAGVVVLIIKLLKNCSKSIGSLLRSKALLVLLSMAKDDESKKIMLEEGASRLAIHSLTGSSEKEREHAVKLLLEFSNDDTYCTKVASEKGALVLLSGMADNLENPSLSNLAEAVLKRMEMLENNISHLAAAGRFEPLLKRLCEGPDNIKIQMASVVADMTLTNNSREQIARRGAKVLIELLSHPEGRTASLRALSSLSCLEDNASVLLDSSVLPALTDILFANDAAPLELKKLAASIIANIVSSTGHWELASADRAGHTMQSEAIVCSLMQLLASAECQVFVLKILCGISSSPQASESVTAHIKSGDGIQRIMTFLEHFETESRIYAFRLTRILSERLGEDLTKVFKSSQKLHLLKHKILDNQSTDGERADAACILANLFLSEDEVQGALGARFVSWTVVKLKDQQRRPNTSMVEGLLGLLLHFTRNPDPEVIKENSLMHIFRDQIVFSSRSRVKELAARGLQHLSECGKIFVAAEDFEPKNRQRVCSPLIFSCGRAPPVPSTCPFHDHPCKEDSQLCLLKSNCIKPLVDILNYKDTSVQIAAVEALSTLLSDTCDNPKRAIDELESYGVVDAVILLFTQARPGELQEKTIWMVERMLRVENSSHKHSLNQSLIKALVEAFKYGSPITKRHAQDALTSLKQISGVSGKTSSQNRGRR